MRIGGSWRYVVFGVAIVLMMMLRPQGMVTRAMVDQLSPAPLGIATCGEQGRCMAASPALALNGVSKQLRRPHRDRQRQLRGSGGRAHGADRPERRRQDDFVQSHFRCLSRSTPAASSLDGAADRGNAAAAARARRLARSFQNIRLMPHLSVVENVMLGQHMLANGFGPTARARLAWQRNSRWRRLAEASLRNAGIDVDPDSDVSTAVLRRSQANRSRSRADEPTAATDARRTGRRT